MKLPWLYYGYKTSHFKGISQPLNDGYYKESFYMSKLLRPNCAARTPARRTTPLHGTAHLCPCTCTPPGTQDLVILHHPFPWDTPASPAYPTPLHTFPPCRKANSGHNRDHASTWDYLYSITQTPLPKEAVILQS